MNRMIVFALFMVVAIRSGGGAAASAAQVAAPPAEQSKASFYAAVARKEHAAALEAGRRYLALRPGDELFTLDYAYELLAAGRRPEGDALLNRLASSKNPKVAEAARKQLAADAPSANEGTGDSTALLQTAYDQSAKGDHAGAIVSLQQYLEVKPGDEDARLQLGYEYASAGRNAEAKAEFYKLESSANAGIAGKAKSAALALEPASSGAADRGSLYGYAIHDNRFADTFYGADLRYDLGSARIVPYVVAHLSNDTRSGVPGASEVFNDNAVVLAAGVRTALSRRLTAFAEAGQSVGLRGKESFPEVRYGLTYYAEFGHATTGHTTLDGSAVEYSRFANFISYASLTHDFPVAGNLRGLAGINAAFDAHRLYYNNYGEVFGGLQYAIAKPLTLRVTSAYGTYFDRGLGIPYRSYQSTRTELIFGISFR